MFYKKLKTILKHITPPYNISLRKDRSKEEYWSWFASALFLLITVDLITTFGAAARFGTDGEYNQFMAFLIESSTGTIIAAHLLIIILASSFFYALLEILDSNDQVLSDTPSPNIPYPNTLLLDSFIAVLYSYGLFIFANNLYIIFNSQSLFEIIPI